jgi:hypothetical protein
MIGEGDCGEIGGMKIGKGNRSTRRKPAPAPLCPPQIPRHLYFQLFTTSEIIETEFVSQTNRTAQVHGSDKCVPMTVVCPGVTNLVPSLLSFG